MDYRDCRYGRNLSTFASKYTDLLSYFRKKRHMHFLIRCVDQ